MEQHSKVFPDYVFTSYSLCTDVSLKISADCVIFENTIYEPVDDTVAVFIFSVYWLTTKWNPFKSKQWVFTGYLSFAFFFKCSLYHVAIRILTESSLDILSIFWDCFCLFVLLLIFHAQIFILMLHNTQKQQNDRGSHMRSVTHRLIFQIIFSH